MLFNNPALLLKDSKRIKYLYVAYEVMLNALMSPLREEDGKVLVMSQEGLPTGCQVVRMSYVKDRRAFCCYVHHDSFPEVPDDACPPELVANISASYYRIVEDN